MKRLIIATLSTLTILITAIAFAQSSGGDFEIIKSTIDNCGGKSSNDVLVVGNRITSTDEGINFISSTGKYMDNLTGNVATPFTGGTAVGTNN